MAYPYTEKLALPLKHCHLNSYHFKQKCYYDNVYWGIHLGEDINCPANTKVFCIGRGRVVYSTIHPGDKNKKNWGNIIIVAHKNPLTKKVFFSLYAHLQKRFVKKGDSLKLNQIIGTVGKSNSPENGYWKEAHLHFAIYTGKWNGLVLPGYWKEGDFRTKLSDWKNPIKFISSFNKQRALHSLNENL